MNTFVYKNSWPIWNDLTPQRNSHEVGSLEIGGTTYQYFVVDILHMGISNPLQPSGSPPAMVPIAGPFTNFYEAKNFSDKLLYGVPMVVLLPTHIISSHILRP